MTYKDMLGRQAISTVEEARAALDEALATTARQTEDVDITDALGRVLAAAVVSEGPLPDFARSSMDGYAVRAADTYGATDGLPAYLKIAGEVPMGEAPAVSVGAGEVVRISTGGMLPEGADAVVMFEHAQTVGDAEVEVVRPAAPGENVVQRGDDVGAGELILDRGRRLRPQDIGALAGIGVTTVSVYRRPTVGIINTGNEIDEATVKHPTPGRVRDVNSYNLAGLVTQSGAVPVRKGIFRDEYASIRAAVEAALAVSDVVAITGGSSVGTGDLTARVINDIGKPGVIVHGVSVRPGKPVIIGVVSGKPVFGLPGHPVAVTVSFELFIKPLLKKMSGEVDELGLWGVPDKRVVRAKMARNYSSALGREDHLRVALEKRADGLWAKPVLGKSGLISTLVKAHGTVVIPLARTGLSKGEEVDVTLFD